MAAFWNNLQWPKVAERYAFVTAVVNVCVYVYVNIISNSYVQHRHDCFA